MGVRGRVRRRTVLTGGAPYPVVMSPRDEDETRRFLERALRILRDEMDAERVILFGSRAGGESRATSDVDLLVVMDSDESPLDRRVRVRRRLASGGPRIPFDLVVLTPDELESRLAKGDRFVEQILERGRILHAA